MKHIVSILFIGYAFTERGNTSVTIEGNSLKAGMYLYTLIADGKDVDTKRMILTK